MASRSIFVTATDTDAGKTWVTASALRSLLAQGIDARGLKPIACGADTHGHYGDIDALQAAQGLTDTDIISRYRFELAAAPSQAAAAAGETIEPDKLVAWCREHKNTSGTTLIEGVGGLMVPLTERYLVSDWIAAMPECALWLVIGCRLGAINQSLLTLAQLERMGRPPERIFLNAVTPEGDAWLEPTRSAIAPFLPAGCRLHLLGHGDPATIHDM